MDKLTKDDNMEINKIYNMDCIEGIADSQLYKLAGNGWEINIVSLILKEMKL